MAQPVIETNNLTKRYGKDRGIEDVSLRVEESEVFGFIGPNGAGKSTTIRTLLSLIYKTSGEAKIFGKDVVAQRKEILQEVGYLPSEVFYYEKMRAIDLLNYSASFYHKDCSARIEELAEILELDLSRKIDDLSFGNRKKVGIVQGLLHSPKLIILDEPTGGLDPLIQNKFFELIQQENERGATVFFSSHILSEVQKVCDRVAIIKDGKIVTTEKISTLRDNAYKKIAVTAKATIPAGYFASEGIAGLEEKGAEASFMFSGNINDVTHKLSALDLVTVSIEEPTLEELFLHYYK